MSKQSPGEEEEQWEEFQENNTQKSLRMRPDPVIFEIYSSHGDSGGETGIGPLLAYHRDPNQAAEYCKKKGWYGCDGAVVEHRCMEINGEYYLLEQSKPIKLDLNVQQVEAELKQRALDKLTPEERKILGLA